MSDFDSIQDFIIIVKRPDAKNDEQAISTMLDKIRALGYDVVGMNRNEISITARRMAMFMGTKLSPKVFTSAKQVEELKQAICDELGIAHVKIPAGKSRVDVVKFARQLFHAVLMADNYAHPRVIGGLWGQRDRSTVLHSVQVIANMIEAKDKEYYDSIMRILKRYDLQTKFGIYE